MQLDNAGVAPRSSRSPMQNLKHLYARPCSLKYERKKGRREPSRAYFKARRRFILLRGGWTSHAAAGLWRSWATRAKTNPE